MGAEVGGTRSVGRSVAVIALLGGFMACPPTDWGEFVQIHDDRDVFQASPDELPAIDIRNRL